LRNYRDKFGIIADILRIAKNKPKKTQIMYQANLSYKVCKKYLTEITAASLISYIGDKRYYVLTEKGREFLLLYDNYSKANSIILKRLKDAQIKREQLENFVIY
jgi:predicted transcriptional regulator